MRVLLAQLLAVTFVLSPAALSAQQTQASEPTVATWGGLLWIVLIVGVAVGFIALAMLGLRSGTKD